MSSTPVDILGTLSSLDPVIYVALIAVAAGVITYFLGENSKRKWALADELWRLKFAELNKVIHTLTEMKRATAFTSVIQKQILEENQYKMGERRYIEEAAKTLGIWQIVNPRYLKGKTEFIMINFREDPPCDSDRMSGQRVMLVANLSAYVFQEQLELSESIAKLKLIVHDPEIIDEVSVLMDKMNETTGLPGHSPNALTVTNEELGSMLENLVNKAKVELDRTRRAKDHSPIWKQN